MYADYLLDTIPLDELIMPGCRNELTTSLVVSVVLVCVELLSQIMHFTIISAHLRSIFLLCSVIDHSKMNRVWACRVSQRVGE